jgi:DNA-binding GntR family transcriptional regulator
VGTSKKQIIYQAIKKKILSTSLKPGDVLSDRRLAEELKVSRTPVREALNLLQMDNYVVQENGRGYCVKELSLRDIADIYTVREALEIAALKQGTDNLEDPDIKEIGRILKKHETLTKSYKPKGTFLDDADFHRTLAGLSKNNYLLQILESIYERIEMLKNIEGVQTERIRIAHEQHMQIYESMKKGDWQKAATLLSNHILDSKNDIIKRIQKWCTLHY